ncbi:glutathione S-transferase N-terminal domain-containing protein [uncultured Anaerococcus sp.]|uniref:glutaredoxin family protein n=1 Tax=uncultured Anaerococcus sp. TaxID=293428 RepID=UPI002889FC1E|nr:glutathione S-transferase N-terminal domain-containing protein [uncultured Anaerococcus sp.]
MRKEIKREWDFELYFKPDCPYCLKVLNYFRENDIIKFPSYNTEDVNSGYENQDKLIAIGGKVQVPCMVIDGKAMYESDDIIVYAKENFLEKAKNNKANRKGKNNKK